MINCKLTGSSWRIQIQLESPVCLCLDSGCGSPRELWKPSWAPGCWWQRAKLPDFTGKAGGKWPRRYLEVPEQGPDPHSDLATLSQGKAFWARDVLERPLGGVSAVQTWDFPCVSPSRRSWARTQRAEPDQSPGSGLAPRWHLFLGKGGVYDQLFGRTGALLHTV